MEQQSTWLSRCTLRHTVKLLQVLSRLLLLALLLLALLLEEALPQLLHAWSGSR
jgi:hypothetical protein